MNLYDLTILCKILILLTTGAFLIYLMLRKQAHKQPLALFILMFFSLLILVNWGSFQHIFPYESEPQPHKERKTVLFQWHEIWHYYTGSKYFNELGYYGLYDAYALADFETQDPNITGVQAINVRDLKDTHRYYPTSKALQNAYTIYKPRFSDERWEEFKQDYLLLKKIADNRWLDLGLWDAGFNPPPTWSVIGSTITNLISISEPWSDDNYYSQALIFPYFDVLLLVLMAVLIYRSFGIIGLTSFFIIFGTSYISELRWNMGSFLRYMWLFGLVGGVCMLKEKQYFKAGLFLGFSTCCRAFPFMFLMGAGLSLLYKGFVEKNWKPFLQLVYGSAAIGFSLFILGLIMFGWSAYAEFLEMIGLHKNVSFIQSIGYRKIATYGDWMGLPINFMWEAGLDNFRNWNEGQVDVWNQVKYWHYPVILLMLGGVIYSLRNISSHEATLLWGGMFLFFSQILTCYYYVYLALIPVVLFDRQGQQSIRNCIILGGFFLAWAFTAYGPKIHWDGIIANYYICWSLFLFFLIWVLARAVPVPQALQQHCQQAWKNMFSKKLPANT